MRIAALAIGILLTIALVSLAPDADAIAECHDVAGQATVCVPGGCSFQSDCCEGVSFWCPENE